MDEIIQLMQKGLSLEEAAIKLEINPSDAKKWYDKGWHKEGEMYINFFKKARSLKYSNNSSKTKINETNVKHQELSEEQKQSILNKFNNFLNSQKEYINNAQRRVIRNKFNSIRYDYYSILKFGRLIDEYNRKFIDNEKIIIQKELNDFLDSQDEYIDDSIKESLKDKYNKIYYSYYSVFNMGKLIDKHNNNFVFNEKKVINKEFNNFLDSQEGFIDNSVKESFKKKYYRHYCNYYSSLNMSHRINEYNNKFINSQKKVILDEFNVFLDSQEGYIDEDIKKKFKQKYNYNYYKYYDELNFEEKINKFNTKFINDFKKELEDKYISNSEKLKLKKSLTYNLNIDEIIEEHNAEYIERNLELDRDYFDNIGDIRLDKDQIRAVLTDDDVTQIVAGAGTGKTMTIQAKVKYLIEKKGISPTDILCISYSNSACDDLALKLEKTLGSNIIEVRTFHSVGFSILKHEGEGRNVPSHEIRNLIDNYFKEEVYNKPELIKEVIEFFCYYYDIIYLNQSNLNFETLRYKINKLDEFEEVLQEEMGIPVIEDKEYVNSIYDLIIANYLFIHNIDYNISEKLVTKTKEINSDSETESNKEFECYCNFYLPENDVYINLLDFKPNWEITIKNKQEIIKYLEKIDKINRKSDTKILNIYDYGDDIDSVLGFLDENLRELGFKINEIDYFKLFELLIINNNLKEYNDFIKNVETFINLFKGNASNIDEEGNDISKYMFKQYKIENNEKFTGSLQKRNNFFLDIIEKIYEIYTNKIRDAGYIDFNDMINEAVIALRKGAEIHKFKYIIVDEYQDTSHTRYNLLKEMQNRTGAKLVVVGDDWQSIYGFTGCDVSLFSNFNQYFENSKMVKIEVTYRNSQDLIDVCGEFIQKNKNQIPKELKSAKGPRNKPIKLVGYVSRAEVVLSLLSILDEIAQKDEDAKILILGRNNGDKNQIACKEILTQIEFDDYTNIVYSKNPKLNIEFRTVHKSKGLQSDYVIILNLNNKINGFPNKIVNDSILNFVENKFDENIPYPEERRLFYVALTRTENDVYVFHNSLSPSIFIDEIKGNSKVKNLKFAFSNEEIHNINLLLDTEYEIIETNLDCPNCNSGKIKLIVNNVKGTSGFKCSNNCRWDGGSYHNIDKGEYARKISHLKYAKVCDWCHHMLVVTPRKINPKIKFLGCNHFPNCRNSESLPKDFVDIDYKIMKLNKTRNNVYYLYKYIPSEKINDYTSDEIENTEKIWGYKDGGDEYLISLFTKELMETITKIVNRNLDDDKKEIVLVPVPSSKIKHKNNATMRKTINIIETWCKNGITDQNFGCKHEIINCNDLIYRVTDVPTAHLGEGRASCDEHIASMKCNEDLLSSEQIFIILDDVTTTGNSMKACKQILINHGADNGNIYTLAIGATVRDDDEEI